MTLYAPPTRISVERNRYATKGIPAEHHKAIPNLFVVGKIE
jgi:hypothetical protein